MIADQFYEVKQILKNYIIITCYCVKKLKQELGFAYFSTGKWDLRHWGWDLANGTGKRVANNGNGKDVL